MNATPLPAPLSAPTTIARRRELRSKDGAMTELSDQARQVVESFQTLQDPDQKKAVVNELQADPALVPDNNRDKLRLWQMLFWVLGAIGIVLAVGAVWCLLANEDTSASILVGPVTAIITGMLGLFAASPTGSGG
jgi:hypothetical protein